MAFLRDACTSLEKATRRFESRNVRHYHALWLDPVGARLPAMALYPAQGRQLT